MAAVPDSWINRANEGDGLYAIAAAIANLELEVKNVAIALERLGNNDAATQMGALEAHGKYVGDALYDVAQAIRKDV